MSQPLFQITEEHLETGLRGFPVGYCTTSSVDPDKGLFYRGKPVSELCHWSAEKTIYLLYHGQEPSEQELKKFIENLQQRSHLSRDLIEHIHHLPRRGHPMALFSCAIMMLGMYELTGDYKEDCLNLIAKVPLLGAYLINYHANFGATPAAEPHKGYIENFVHMLACPKSEGLTEAMRLFNILHYDHGGGNLSTFVGKAVASGLEDLYGSIAAAMNALAGPRHGRANQESLEFVKGLVAQLGSQSTQEEVEQAIRDKLANKELVYGFGHAVLRVEDPRASVYYEVGERHYAEEPLMQMALKLRKAGTKVLKENPKITNPYPNVDAVSGALLTAAGFPYPEYYTVLFGISRCVGIAIQIVYERTIARGGKGTPIVRPKYIYRP